MTNVKDSGFVFAGYNYPKKPATILFNPGSWVKMCSLVTACPTEIAWNGLVRKITDRKYIVYDILTFKQYVNGAATTTDQNEYQKWLFHDNGLNDPIYFHGHSHVNFPSFRSGRDANYQESIARSMGRDDFFIFLIMNKRGEMHGTIVNNKQQCVWDTDHDNLCIGITGMSLFVKDALNKVHPMSELPEQATAIGDEFITPDSGADGVDPDEEMLDQFTKNDPWARNEV